MSKKINRLITAAFVTVMLFACGAFVYAGTDSTAPVCTGIEIENAEIVKPGVLTVTVSFDERGTGINYFSIQAMKDIPSSKNYSRVNFDKCWEIYQQSAWGNEDKTGEWYMSGYDGTIKSMPKRHLFTYTVTLDLPIGDYLETGTWHIRAVEVKDVAKNGGSCKVKSFATVSGTGTDSVYEYANGERSASYTASGEPVFTTRPVFEIKDEFDYQFEDSLSNPYLIDDINKLEDGKSAKLLIDTTTVIPKAVFDAIKGQDKRIVVYNQNYQWIFYGEDIVNDTKDVDAAISFNTVSENEYKTQESSCVVVFKNNGVLPGKAEIRIASNYAYDLYNKKSGLLLYYIDNNSIEKQDNAEIGIQYKEDKKWCKFTVTHNSKYLLAGSEINSNCSLTGHAYNKVSKGSNCYARTCTKCGKKDNYCSVSYLKSPKASSGKKCFTVKWKRMSKSKQKKFSGYRIRYSLKSDMSGAKTVYAKKSASSKKISKLKAKKTYYVEMCSYVKKGGVKYYSKKTVKKIRTR